MEPRLVSFEEMRTPSIVGEIRDINQEFVVLSQGSLNWDNYVVDTAFIPAALVEHEKVIIPSLAQLAKVCRKFRKIFVGTVTLFVEFKKLGKLNKEIVNR